MKNFAEKIRSLISLSGKQTTAQDSTPFDFVKSRKAILRELTISKEAKNIVGVYCKVFGEGMVLTAVEDIERTVTGEIIVFHQYDMNGRPLSRTRIGLDEVQMVCPFGKTYQNPLNNKRDKAQHAHVTASV